MVDKIKMTRNAFVGAQDKDYPYLVHEDSSFCRAFRLSEDEFLKLCGGLKKYTHHRLNRSEARNKGFEIPHLVDNTEEAMSHIQLDLKEEDFAAYLLGEQIEKVQGCADTIKLNKEFEALAQKEEKEKAEERERMLAGFRREAATSFGWDENSQSAKDWAEKRLQEWNRQHPPQSVMGA